MPGGHDQPPLTTVIASGDRIVLDTSAVIAYLVGNERASGAATAVLDQLVASDRNPAIISAITVAELLVRPVASGRAATIRAFVLGFPGLSVRSADVLVAAEAGRIRAVTGAAMPDALIAATATLTTSHWLITNDRELRDRLSRLEWQTKVLLLDDVRV